MPLLASTARQPVVLVATILAAVLLLAHSTTSAYPPTTPRDLRCNDDADARTGRCQLAWNLVGSRRSRFQVEVWGSGDTEWRPTGPLYHENYHVTEVGYPGGAFYRVVACDADGRACRPSRVTYVLERPDEADIPLFVIIRDASGVPNHYGNAAERPYEDRLRRHNILRTGEIISQIDDLSAWGELTAPREWDNDRFDDRPADLTEYETAQWDIYSGYLTAISGRAKYRARRERDKRGGHAPGTRAP